MNSVRKNFIDSQLRNFDRATSGRRWTEEDKSFALSMYKRSPRLYRYLAAYFQLPSTRTLKGILSKIPFSTGISTTLLQQVKLKIADMSELDKCCSLIFDEISLSNGFHYEPQRQEISGFQDMGELGRSPKAVNHALVIMIRGLRKSWKQVVVYYFVSDTVSADHLKVILKKLITELQNIGLKVMATICDQGSTQKKALKELCAETRDNFSPYIFFC